MKKDFTILIHAENALSLLVRLTGIFSRRRIPIQSLSVVADVESTYQFAIAIRETEDVVVKLTQQIEKQVEVFEVFLKYTKK